ncbi:hypothetical protein Lbir_1032 [Legionella birminghamensis]|uniref:Uncharacterized protein n=1 Tax=Legionella birminghamensis TaxID=28083 RepID=A0A378I6U8_9GAMM|nr:hypothetical protein [Legionella birminghamensis]KTC73770.1 hypothetical protein Lbir_1032 [Legionella birminghamensis]STX30733.1 Uncharacterised protein [Legionella birminghamensis]
MYSFFKSLHMQQSAKLAVSFSSQQKRGIASGCEHLVTKHREFSFSHEHSNIGHLLQINLHQDYVKFHKNHDELSKNPPTQVIGSIVDMVKKYPNSLFIGVTPTQKMSKGSGLYPGHGFSFLTDQKGGILGHISKRPNTASVVDKRNAFRDPQFEGKSSNEILNEEMNVYSPQYSVFETDITKWHERSRNLEGHYPLLLVQLPLGPGVKVTLKEYLSRTTDLITEKEPYHLYPTRKDGRMLRPNNCLTAVARVVLGIEYYSTLCDSMYCQQALVELVKCIVQNSDDFVRKAQELQLLEGVEHCPLSNEDFLGPFLC